MAYSNSALVLEGGGVRNVFSAGVLKAFAEVNYNPFECYIGVSGGTYTLISYLSEQQERNYNVFSNILTSKKYLNFARFLRGGDYMDLNWLWREGLKLYPISFDIMERNLFNKKYYGVVTKVLPGINNEPFAEYYIITSENMRNILISGSSIPLLFRATQTIENNLCLDGGISDPLPVKKAYELGYKKILLIRTYPKHYIPDVSKYKALLKLFGKQNLIKYLDAIVKNYKSAMAFIESPPENIQIDIISPDKKLFTKMNTQSKQKIKSDYQYGTNLGIKYLEKL